MGMPLSQGRDLPSLSWIQGCFLILMCMRNIFKNGVMLIHKLQVSTIINSQSFTFSIILLSEFSSVRSNFLKESLSRQAN